METVKNKIQINVFLFCWMLKIHKMLSYLWKLDKYISPFKAKMQEDFLHALNTHNLGLLCNIVALLSNIYSA